MNTNLYLDTNTNFSLNTNTNTNTNQIQIQIHTGKSLFYGTKFVSGYMMFDQNEQN